MLRTLLEDRFRLAVHRESKELPGYALVVANKGFKLKPVEPGGPGGTESKGGPVVTLTGNKTLIAQLAGALARSLEQPVVDQTGIDGVYDFELRWTRNDKISTTIRSPNDTDDTAAELAPSVFTALPQTLGLRLQPQRVAVEIVIVGHVDRLPTEN